MGNNINGAKYRNAPNRVVSRVLAAARGTSDQGCWIWRGEISRDGYALTRYRVGSERPMIYIHRLVYMRLVADIDDSLEIDHKCHDPAVCTGLSGDCPHRRCYNPDHLEAVTPKVNALRSGSVSGKNARRDACAKGHPYTEANTRWYRGMRQCRTCHRAWKAASYQRTGESWNARRRAQTVARRQGRCCTRCGADISHRIAKAIYCEGCADAVKRAREKARWAPAKARSRQTMATREQRGRAA